MRASPQMDPAAAFPKPVQRPIDSDLTAALGPAFDAVGQILDRLHAAHPEVTSAWQFSTRAGWYQVQLLRKRRLLYLVPRRHDFRLSLILGGKAISALKAGSFAARLNRLLKTARHYPEGTAFTFEPATIDPDLCIAFIEAKISPEGHRPGTAAPAAASRFAHT